MRKSRRERCFGEVIGGRIIVRKGRLSTDHPTCCRQLCRHYHGRMPIYGDLRERNILVTGGANGIGAAIVRAFHAQGAHVHFCDTYAAAGQALARELGPRVSFTRVDLAREAEIVRWIKRTTKDGTPIHVLVNNAARDPRMTLDSMSA